MEYKFYKHTGISTEIRPYIEGENLAGVNVDFFDHPEVGGVIARNVHHHEDQWYITKSYFENFIEVKENE